MKEGNKPNTNSTSTVTGKHVVASTDEDSLQINVEKPHNTHAHTYSTKDTAVKGGLSDAERGTLLSIVNQNSKPSSTEVRYKDLMEKELEDENQSEFQEKPIKASVYAPNKDSSSSENEGEEDEEEKDVTGLDDLTSSSVGTNESVSAIETLDKLKIVDATVEDNGSQSSENEDLKEEISNTEEKELDEEDEKDVEPKDVQKGDKNDKVKKKRFSVEICVSS